MQLCVTMYGEVEIIRKDVKKTVHVEVYTPSVGKINFCFAIFIFLNHEIYIYIHKESKKVR